jgi:hypothetical protein
MSTEGGKLLSVDSRPIRNLGNAYGFSLDKRALEELGVIDENGQVRDGITARIKIADDGTVTADLPIDG